MSLERRHIRLEGVSNMRDIGGYATADGRQVRWGTIYRSGALWRLSSADWAWIEERGIRTICDLRSHEERELAPTEWRGLQPARRADTPYDAERLFFVRRDDAAGVGEMQAHLYFIFARLLAPSLKLFLDALLDGHAPAIVHCTAGQDRTGLAIGLLLNILGVSEQTILDDYHLSTQLRRVEYELDHEQLRSRAEDNLVARFYSETLRRKGAEALRPRPLFNAEGVSLLSVAFAAIEREWGSIGSYLAKELGIGASEIQQLQRQLLE